tara:strand:+ start:1094 stop:2632 length:1539 start_codon:yes stop_codon:yes gene_type:complete
MDIVVDQIYDAIIVGSGPAGVSSAWPLVENGKKILMLDVGFNSSEISLNTNINLNSSPKVRAPEFSHVFREYKNLYNIETENFTANGSLAIGGLSNAWSTLVSSFTTNEFDEFPFKREEIVNNYNFISKRIGVSGDRNGDLKEWLGQDYNLQPNLPIHSLVDKLLKRYEKKKSFIQNLNIKMGRHHQAILSLPVNNRPAFTQYSMLGYKNTDGSAYNSSDEISNLNKFQNFKYIKKNFVYDLKEIDNICHLKSINLDDNKNYIYKSKLIILAAGTIGTTKLVLKLSKHFNKPITLKNTPMYPFALFFPQELFRRSTFKAFTYWHMSYFLSFKDLPAKYKAYGHLTPTDGINPSELSKRIPIFNPIDKWIANYVWPKMLLGTCIFPGYFSNNKITLNEKNVLKIIGNTKNNFSNYVYDTKKILKKAFSNLGGIFITDKSLPTLGEDSHYASTLPMRIKPGKLETDLNGALYGFKNIHCVDGSVLSELPAKSHTFTIMANADRISRNLVNKLNK